MAPLSFAIHHLLSWDAPTNFPHIIEKHHHPSCVNTPDLRLCDSICTLLYNVMLTSPGSLEALLDRKNVLDFKLVLHGYRDRYGSSKFFVWRRGDWVISGFYRHPSSPSTSCLGTAHPRPYTLITKSQIKSDGSWEAIWGAEQACGMNDSMAPWTANFVEEERDRRRKDEQQVKREARDVSWKAANVLFLEGLWDVRPNDVEVLVVRVGMFSGGREVIEEMPRRDSGMDLSMGVGGGE
ncbi:hypothetical protein CC78DRAFT_581077 [Lojkania enalia]|uniref:Uncharacterized protein n=1 Tax=Lojkania enalia TaxID=147567 RepID=A0A9P4N3L6_9PLEO|nr:hypothetical protein CC78DRAFT_581077 [Didymosphaeria enalia]